MTAELTRWLDELEAAREKALTIRKNSPLPVMEQAGEGVLAVWDDASMVWEECEHEDDAALIVAAVNALPELIRLARERYAIERAVLDLAKALDKQAAEWAVTKGDETWPPEDRAHALGRESAYGNAAACIRAAVTGALEGQR